MTPNPIVWAGVVLRHADGTVVHLEIAEPNDIRCKIDTHWRDGEHPFAPSLPRGWYEMLRPPLVVALTMRLTATRAGGPSILYRTEAPSWYRPDQEAA